MKTGPLPQIFVHNRQRKIAVVRAGLEQFAHWALPLVAQERGTGLGTLDEIHVLLISDRRIAQLHARFMQLPGPTDVITFQHGEICISVETARRQAKTHGTSLAHELQLYLLHGLLHLHGFDDRTPAARRRMHALQGRIMARRPAALG
jgi:probable rRNA maturation factor